MRIADRYKVSPWEVWRDWPLWFVEASHNAIPHLQAAESFRTAEEIAVGTGSFTKKSQSRQVVGRWHRDYAGGETKAAQSKKGFEKMMAGLGVGGNSQ